MIFVGSLQLRIFYDFINLLTAKWYLLKTKVDWAGIKPEIDFCQNNGPAAHVQEYSSAHQCGVSWQGLKQIGAQAGKV